MIAKYIKLEYIELIKSLRLVRNRDQTPKVSKICRQVVPSQVVERETAGDWSYPQEFSLILDREVTGEDCTTV